MSLNQQEYKLQIKVVEHLRIYFPFLLFTHPANRAASKQEGYFHKMMGVKAGVADLLFWWDKWDKGKDTPFGVCIDSGAIELKAPQGRRSPKQGSFEKSFISIGGKHAYCKSVKEVHETLISWGVEPVKPCGIFEEPDYRTQQEKFQDGYDWMAP